MASSSDNNNNNNNDSSSNNNGTRSRRVIFPLALHNLLEATANDRLENIVSWVENGTAFKIHDRFTFTEVILPRFFKTTSFKSFQRSLNLWDFRLVRKGPKKGNISHPLFIRGQRNLAYRFERVLVKNGKRGDENNNAAVAAMPSVAMGSTLRGTAATGSPALPAMQVSNVPAFQQAQAARMASAMASPSAPDTALSQQVLRDHCNSSQSVLPPGKREALDPQIASLLLQLQSQVPNAPVQQLDVNQVILGMNILLSQIQKGSFPASMVPTPVSRTEVQVNQGRVTNNEILTSLNRSMSNEDPTMALLLRQVLQGSNMQTQEAAASLPNQQQALQGALMNMLSQTQIAAQQPSAEQQASQLVGNLLGQIVGFQQQQQQQQQQRQVQSTSSQASQKNPQELLANLLSTLAGTPGATPSQSPPQNSSTPQDQAQALLGQLDPKMLTAFQENATKPNPSNAGGTQMQSAGPNATANLMNMLAQALQNNNNNTNNTSH